MNINFNTSHQRNASWKSHGHQRREVGLREVVREIPGVNRGNVRWDKRRIRRGNDIRWVQRTFMGTFQGGLYR